MPHLQRACLAPCSVHPGALYRATPAQHAARHISVCAKPPVYTSVCAGHRGTHAARWCLDQGA
eukprot:13158881-Alexandrium_andersonii.AAC.1